MSSSESASIFVGLIFAAVLYYRFKRIRKSEKRQVLYRTELAMHEGLNFFCYNNRKDAQHFIEQYILAKLPPETKIVFLHGRQVQSEYPAEFIKTMLMNLRHYKKFPHLCKIRNSRIEDMSINNLFYDVKNQKKETESLIAAINIFFSK